MFNLKRIAINIAKKFAYIKNCNITINVEVKITCIVVYKRVYVRKVVDILLQLKITISIYYTIILSDRKFLFELN